MPVMSTAEVTRLAALARIALLPEEIERLAGDLDVIVEAVAKVSSVVTEDTPATSHPIPLTNVMRPDVVEPAVDTAEVLAMAPDAENGRFRVPQILEED